MTEPRTIRRRRRIKPDDTTTVPQPLLDWFAAGCPEQSRPWEALLSPTYERLPAYWSAWTAGRDVAPPQCPILRQRLGMQP